MATKKKKGKKKASKKRVRQSRPAQTPAVETSASTSVEVEEEIHDGEAEHGIDEDDGEF